MKNIPKDGSILRLLRSQAFGGRRECLSMLRKGTVEWSHGPRDRNPGDFSWTEERDPDAVLDTTDLWLRAGGLALPVLSTLYTVLHKPPGVECSRNPAVHAPVFDFFPEPFVRRGLQPAGRLDADTTGLLILTDDGRLNHAVTSPKRKLPKTYRVGLKHPLTDEQVTALEQGVVLRDDPEPTAPATVRQVEGDETGRRADITIMEGRYHQVKRMCAAAGNRVESIHRTAVGPVKLGDLPEGAWRFLTPEEITALMNTGRTGV